MAGAKGQKTPAADAQGPEDPNALELRIPSCLVDEAPPIVDVPVTVEGGHVVHFRVRPLTPSERAEARANATERGVTLEVGDGDKAQKMFGPVLSPEKLSAWAVYFALGGKRRIGAEGWDLVDGSGAPLPVTFDAIWDRLYPQLVDHLAKIVTAGYTVTKGSGKNSRPRSA
jgi:hypothetical protein